MQKEFKPESKIMPNVFDAPALIMGVWPWADAAAINREGKGDGYGAVHEAYQVRSHWPAEYEAISSMPSSCGFNALLAAYQATGGATRGEDLADLLIDRERGDLASLARNIVSGEIFSFEWRNSFWIPMFQFELQDLSMKKGPRKVLAELVKVFDPWTIAAWFAQPNSWLKRQKPVDLLDSNLAAVFAAARADRFVANG